jgi:hypothetical protein
MDPVLFLPFPVSSLWLMFCTCEARFELTISVFYFFPQIESRLEISDGGEAEKYHWD